MVLAKCYIDNCQLILKTTVYSNKNYMHGVSRYITHPIRGIPLYVNENPGIPLFCPVLPGFDLVCRGMPQIRVSLIMPAGCCSYHQTS